MGFDNKPAELPRLLTEHEVSRLYSVSVAFLRKKRSKNDGPRYVKINRMIRYRHEDVQKFFDTYLVTVRESQ